MSDTAAARAARGGLWRHRDFRVFWSGETTSQVGTSVSSVAVPLVAVELLHASAFVVTVLTAATWLPWLIIGLPAGGWVDRLPRRPIMLICDAASFLAFVSVPVTAWLGVLSVAQLIAVALTAGSAAVFFQTAYVAYLPSVVDAQDLIEGNAKLTGSRSAAQVAGPGLGGAIVQLFGAATGLLANALSFLVLFACLSMIRAQEPRSDTASERRHLGREVRDGLRFLFSDPFLRTLLVAWPASNFFLTGMSAIDVVFLVRTVGIGPGVVGVVFAVTSIGGVLGAILARRVAQRLGSSRAVLAAAILGRPFVLLLPLTTAGVGLSLWIVGGFILEIAIVISNVLLGSFSQTYVPRAMLGRVSACTSTAAFSMMPAGALVAGGLSAALGLRGAMWVLCAGIAAVALLYLASPIRTTRDLPTKPATSTVN
jgi:MFS family permease